MNKLKINKNENGFTLIELLIAMAISGIVMAGIMTAYKNQQDINTVQNQAVDMQQGIRAVLYIMTSEIKMAGFDPDRDNDVGIIEAGTGASLADKLEFDYVDPESAATPPAKITRRYYLNGSNLQGAGGPIAENIANLEFSYLDVDGNDLPAPVPVGDIPDIRAVQVSITVTPDANERSLNDDRTLSTIIKCRNLGL